MREPPTYPRPRAGPFVSQILHLSCHDEFKNSLFVGTQKFSEHPITPRAQLAPNMSLVPEECLKHPGFGYCFEQCHCECYDVNPASDPEMDDIEVEHETCVCGHREHGTWCQTSGCGTCTLELCAVCGGHGPKWGFSIHYGTCSASCAITAQDLRDQMGPMTASGDGECPICMETKPLYKLQLCGHEFCTQCRKEATDTYRHEYASIRCSLCRQENVARPGEARRWGLG